MMALKQRHNWVTEKSRQIQRDFLKINKKQNEMFQAVLQNSDRTENQYNFTSGLRRGFTEYCIFNFREAGYKASETGAL